MHANKTRRERLAILAVLVFGLLIVPTIVSAQGHALDFGLAAVATESSAPHALNLWPYEPWIGGILHITRWLVFRPSLMAVHTQTEHRDPAPANQYHAESWAWGIANGLYYYFQAKDSLYLFVGGGGTFYNYDYMARYDEDSDQTVRETWLSWGTFASVGVQAMITKRFGFLTEFGVEYRMIDTRSSETNTDGTLIKDEGEYIRNLALRGVYLGAVYYLRSR